MKNNVEPTDNLDFKRLQLFFYLLPVIGFFPSLWTLYCQGKSSVESFDPHSRQAGREQLAVSRLSVTLAGSWLLGYLLLSVGAETSEFLTLRLLVLNSFFTSGYFLVSFWLMARLWQRQPVRLAGFSRLAQMLGKYLS